MNKSRRHTGGGGGVQVQTEKSLWLDREENRPWNTAAVRNTTQEKKQTTTDYDTCRLKDATAGGKCGVESDKWTVTSCSVWSWTHLWWKSPCPESCSGIAAAPPSSSCGNWWAPGRTEVARGSPPSPPPWTVGNLEEWTEEERVWTLQQERKYTQEE